MPAATMAWVAPTVLGGLGLMQANNASHAQSDAVKKAMKAGKTTELAQQAMYNLADAYDPTKEAQAAVNQANDSAGETLRRTLHGLRGDFISGGGQPGGDSEFRVRAQGATTRTLDPLREFIANIEANKTMKKMGAYQAVTGAPVGQIASNYFNAAGSYQPNYGPSMQLLVQAMRNMGGSGGGGNAGGSSTNFGTGGRFGGSPDDFSILNNPPLNVMGSMYGGTR